MKLQLDEVYLEQLDDLILIHFEQSLTIYCFLIRSPENRVWAREWNALCRVYVSARLSPQAQSYNLSEIFKNV